MLVVHDPLRNRAIDELLDAISMRECHFSAQALMHNLEYDDAQRFRTVIEAAVRACAVQHMPVQHHFRTIFISDHETVYQDYRLSWLACYLIVMNADPAYPVVAQAQLRLAQRASET